MSGGYRVNDLVEYYSVSHGDSRPANTAITCYRTLISLIMSSLSHRIRTENEDWLPATIVKTDTDGRIIIDLKPDSQGLDFQETSRQGGLVIARCRRERGEREREREAAAHKTTQKRSFASYRQGQTHGSPRRRGTPATLKTFGNYQQMLEKFCLFNIRIWPEGPGEKGSKEKRWSSTWSSGEPDKLVSK